jgi:ABC-type proline/glycine betaine transport system ATPase subunit
VASYWSTILAFRWKPEKFSPLSVRAEQGKSSFLRLLNPLDEPTDGIVLLDGKDYKDIPPRELRRRVGMVMQMAYLFAGNAAVSSQLRSMLR